MNKNLYRQGDVLIERISAIPATAQRVDKTKHDRIILAHGEATGHHHSLDIDAADWWKSADDAQQYIAVASPTEVVHQEHAAVKLPRGKYRVTRQREYSPEAIRRVAD